MLVAIVLLAGCKSGVERDVVQREMRQQEDQIYALEDYLSEYQQLLCNARSENAMLKRQMVQGQFRSGQSGAGSDDSNSLPPPQSTPPTAPPGAEPDVDATTAPPDVPPLDLSPPAVPPLKDQSANEPAPTIAQEVQPAAAEIEVVGATASAVVLRGEVQLEDKTGGPRVLVEVEPVTDAGALAAFRGRLSLLVLDPAAREKEQQLARWDFADDELDAMAKSIGSGTSFEFPLQLPADAPTNRPLELWVRLIPDDGEKVLGRTTLDLSRDGQFASAEVKPTRKKRRPVTPVVAEMPIEPKRLTIHRGTPAGLEESGWETAKPGDKGKLRAVEIAGSEWKLATRPVPVVESAPVVESRPVTASTSGGDERYNVAAAPEWSPARPERGDAEPSAEPAWSPTR
jgi:hypothetical protein